MVIIHLLTGMILQVGILKAPGVVQGEGGVKQGESLKDSGNGKIGEQIWGTNRGRNPMSFGDVKGVPSLKRNRFLPLKIGELESRGFRAWKPSLFRGRFLQDLCMWIYMINMFMSIYVDACENKNTPKKVDLRISKAWKKQQKLLESNGDLYPMVQTKKLP